LPIQSAPRVPSNFAIPNPTATIGSSGRCTRAPATAPPIAAWAVNYESFRPQLEAAANEPEMATGPPTGTEIEASTNAVPYQ